MIFLYSNIFYRLEREHKAFEEQKRRDAAAQSTKYFNVDGIQVKLAIFKVTDKEDLTLFAEDFPVEVDENEEGEEIEGTSDMKGESVEINEELFGEDDEDLDNLDDDEDDDNNEGGEEEEG